MRSTGWVLCARDWGASARPLSGHSAPGARAAAVPAAWRARRAGACCGAAQRAPGGRCTAGGLRRRAHLVTAAAGRQPPVQRSLHRHHVHRGVVPRELLEQRLERVIPAARRAVTLRPVGGSYAPLGRAPPRAAPPGRVAEVPRLPQRPRSVRCRAPSRPLTRVLRFGRQGVAARSPRVRRGRTASSRPQSRQAPPRVCGAAACRTS